MDMLQQRAAAARSNPIPNGQARRQAFGAEMRAEKVIWNDRESVKLVGCASTVEKRYRMWDMFGEYDEVVDQRAFVDTLSRQPDVAYLVNHGGVTMARTTNGSLLLSADSKGLQTEAYLNPKRQDVSDLVTAIEDRDVTEMSFAFRIDDGEWNDDFTEFRILKVDLDRGDVSAVNYGANPYTSVAARQSEVLKDVRYLPAGAQRAALADLQQRLAVVEQETRVADDTVQQVAEAEASKTRSLEEIQAALEGPKGRSLKVIQALLDVETAI
jgi:HK97 family phage prohead protease